MPESPEAPPELLKAALLSHSYHASSTLKSKPTKMKPSRIVKDGHQEDDVWAGKEPVGME